MSPAKDVFEIRTFQDLVSALRVRPEWREELRRLILTDELMDLPRKFDAFVQGEFRPLQGDVTTLKQDVTTLKQDVTTLKQDVETLKQDVEVLKRDVEVLKQDVGILKRDVAMLKGHDLERRVRERAPAYFGRLLRRVRHLSSEALAEVLEEAEEEGRITEEERLDALAADVVVRGRLKTGEERVLVAEVSHVVDVRDVERAARRAQVVARALGIPAVPVVLGMTMTQGARQAIEEHHVLSVIVAEA